MMDAPFTASLLQPARASSRAVDVREAERLLRELQPTAVVRLKPGEVRRVSENLLVEKTSDGRIVLYEVIDS